MRQRQRLPAAACWTDEAPPEVGGAPRGRAGRATGLSRATVLWPILYTLDTRPSQVGGTVSSAAADALCRPTPELEAPMMDRIGNRRERPAPPLQAGFFGVVARRQTYLNLL